MCGLEKTAGVATGFRRQRLPLPFMLTCAHNIPMAGRYKTLQTKAALQALQEGKGEKAGAADSNLVVSPNSVFVFAIFFTLYYVCGYPLVIQGYQGVSFANKLQITSGLLAHGAELINPFLYGIFWCKWFMNDGIDGTPPAAGKSVTSSITWGGSDSDAKANVAPNNSIGYSYSVSVV